MCVDNLAALNMLVLLYLGAIQVTPRYIIAYSPMAADVIYQKPSHLMSIILIYFKMYEGSNRPLES